MTAQMSQTLSAIARRVPFYKVVRHEYELSRLRRLIAAMDPLKVVIGSGPTSFRGWIETDRDSLDITSPADWRRLFKPATIDRLLAEHVLEHLSESECRIALRQSRHYLKTGGIFRIAVPDGYHRDATYVEAVRPGGSSPDSAGHQTLFNYRMLSQIATDEGFTCELLEYFDENGQFHRVDWNIEDGFVERSERFDSRNKQSQLAYTSLIVDLRPGPLP